MSKYLVEVEGTNWLGNIKGFITDKRANGKVYQFYADPKTYELTSIFLVTSRKGCFGIANVRSSEGKHERLRREIKSYLKEYYQ